METFLPTLAPVGAAMGVDLTDVANDLTEAGGETFLVGVMEDLPAEEVTDLAGLRLLRAHLGSGCSRPSS